MPMWPDLAFQMFLCLLVLHPDGSRCEEDRMNAILSALERSAAVLEEEYDAINLDAVVGFHILQAFLSKTLEEWDKKPGLELERERVARLEAKVSAWTEKAKHSLELQDPDYYRNFAPALSPGFWKVPDRWTQIDHSVGFPTTNGSCLLGGISDSCISFLLGSWKDGGESCLVPENCKSIMTKTHCSNYALSHQLLYFLFAEMKGCLNPLFLDAQYYKNVFCHLMMQSNLHPKKDVDAPGDIFTENIMFCGLAGFSDFYKPEWLDRILSWQNPGDGCFWMYKPSVPNPEGAVPKPRRFRRREKLLKDECSSHNIAVAVGAIGGFLYYGF
ncbi:UPF0764 protein C16orf89 homolog [Sceloporus undulatus]|uniref:UPF0764 protein C16orf89 homolog n=1 Tax=Sceloporus undulatus TaxID=8520 RepID=UPI001C4CB783|nr:UPF0764 protein C16orf89 homolog [Sceloporus undulatus]